MPLTQYQIDHVRLSIQDMFSRYDPPVDHKMYEVRFVPVKLCNDEKLSDPDAFVIDTDLQKKPHLMRSSKYCWCDQDAKARFDVVGNLSISSTNQIHILGFTGNN